jgi:iron complex outermembrane recepter protein
MVRGGARWLCLLAMTLRLVPVAGSAEADDDLQEVVVTADRVATTARASTGTKMVAPLHETPMALSVLSDEKLEALNIANVVDALKYVAGAQDNVNVWEHSDGYTIRGFDQSAYILLDGQLRNDPGWWSASEPFALERIEVMKGPASVLYGQSPPGGMVAMTSKRPTAAMRNAVEVTAGSYNERGYNVDLGHNFGGDGKWLGRVVATWLTEDDRIETVGFQRRLIQPALTWNVSADTSLTVLGWYQRDVDDYNSDVPAYGTLLDNPHGRIAFDTYLGEPGYDDSYVIEQKSMGYEFNHRFSGRWSFRQNFRHFQVDVTGTDVIYADGLQEDQRTLNRAVSDYTERVRNWQIDSMLTGTFGNERLRNTLLLGVDYGHYDWRYSGDYGELSPIDLFEPVHGQAVQGERFPWVYRSAPRQLAVYAQEWVKIADKLVLLAGGRFDRARNTNDDSETRASTDDGKFSGRLGALYLLRNGLAPYVSYATSFLPVAGTDVNGRAFVPETGRQIEIGAKYEHPGKAAVATLALFDISRANMLTRDPAFPAFQVQNGEQRHRGVELEMTLRPLTGLRIDATGTWLDAEVVASFDPGIQGNRPNDVSNVSASLLVDYALPRSLLPGFGFHIGITHRGDSFGDPENTLRQPAYTLWDAGVRYEWENLRLTLSGSNLTNRKFVSSCWATSWCARSEPRLVSLTGAYRWRTGS